MGRIKRWMQAQIGSVAHIYVRYAGTILFGLFAAIVMIADNQTEWFRDSETELAAKWIAFFLLCAAGSFLTETIFPDKMFGDSARSNHGIWKMAAGYGISVCVAAVCVFGIMSNLRDSQHVAQLILDNAISWYAMSLIGVSLFFLLKRMDISVHEYLGRVVFGLLRLLGIFCVLNIAVYLILFLIDTLLVSFEYWDFMENLEILLGAGLYFPFVLLTIADAQEENRKFTKKFVLYALFPCVLAATLIIYLYIIKIFVTNSVPENEIFNICTCLFLCGLPVWMMAYAFAEKREGVRFFFIKNMKYIYAPFICLEGYALGVRIAQCGLTERRCEGILFMVMQVLYIAWKRERYRNLIFVYIGLAFFAFVLPPSSVTYVSYLSQKSLMQEKNARGAEAFYYLKDNAYGEKYLKEQYTEEELLALQEDYEAYGGEDSSHGISVYFYVNALRNGITFGEGYSSIRSFSINISDVETDRKVSFEGEPEPNAILTTADVRACMDYYYELYQKRESGTEISDADELYETTLAGGQKLIVYSISYSCDVLTGILDGSVRIDGYVIK